MKRIKLGATVDKVFSCIIIFLISFTWLSFVTSNMSIRILLSLSITIFCNVVIFALIGKKSERRTYNSSIVKDIKESSLAIRLMSITQRKKYLASLLPKRADAKLKYTLCTLDTCCIGITYCKVSKLVATDLADIYSEWKDRCDKLIIIADTVDISAVALAQNLVSPKLLLLDSAQAYNTLYKPSGNIPKLETATNAKVSKWTIFKEMVFARGNAKRYFFSSIILVFASFIIPYNLYYIIISTLLLSCALICVLRPLFSRAVIHSVWDK